MGDNFKSAYMTKKLTFKSGTWTDFSKVFGQLNMQKYPSEVCQGAEILNSFQITFKNLPWGKSIQFLGSPEHTLPVPVSIYQTWKQGAVSLSLWLLFSMLGPGTREQPLMPCFQVWHMQAGVVWWKCPCLRALQKLCRCTLVPFKNRMQELWLLGSL